MDNTDKLAYETMSLIRELKDLKERVFYSETNRTKKLKFKMIGKCKNTIYYLSASRYGVRETFKLYQVNDDTYNTRHVELIQVKRGNIERYGVSIQPFIFSLKLDMDNGISIDNHILPYEDKIIKDLNIINEVIRDFIKVLERKGSEWI